MSLARTVASIPALVSRLFAETRDLVSAEVALGRLKVEERIAPYKQAAIFFVIAAVLAFAGLIAFLTGMIIALATLLGPALATIVIAGVVFVLAAIFALIGKSRLSGPPGASS